MSKKHHETRAVARALRKFNRLSVASNAAFKEAEMYEQQEWVNQSPGGDRIVCPIAERVYAEAHALNIKACKAAVRAGLARYAEDGVTLVWERVQHPRTAPVATAEIHPVIVFGDIGA